MFDNGIRIFNYYESVWNTGTQYFKINKKISYHMKLYCVTKLTSLRDQLNEDEKNKLISMINQLKEIKKVLTKDEINISKEEYNNFYKKIFFAIDNEEKETNVSHQTCVRFNYVSDVLEAYKIWDNKIVILQAYCRYKAKTIEDSLNKGLIPEKTPLQDFKYVNGMEYQYFTPCESVDNFGKIKKSSFNNNNNPSMNGSVNMNSNNNNYNFNNGFNNNNNFQSANFNNQTPNQNYVNNNQQNNNIYNNNNLQEQNNLNKDENNTENLKRSNLNNNNYNNNNINNNVNHNSNNYNNNMNNNFKNFNNFSFNSQIFKKSYVNKIINNDNNLLETGFKINQYNDENYLNKQTENLIKINKEIIKEIRKQNYEKAIQFITNNISILKNFPKKKTITTIQE